MTKPWRRVIVGVVGFLIAGVLAWVGYLLVLPSLSWIQLPLFYLAWWLVPDALIAWSDRRRPEKKFSAHPTGNGSSKTRSLVVTTPATETRKAAEGAAAALPGARLVDSGAWHIAVRMPRSWKSFGEEIRVDLRGQERGTHVRVTSRLLLPALADCGKNQANIDVVVSALETAEERYRSGPGDAGGQGD